uniref:Negative elongation factor complex member B n=1 Tax=Electrophorus electricus TaxID=8005 RepID=A0A4W4GV73_ELEEL
MFAGLPELGISNGEDLKETLTNCTEPLKAIDQFQMENGILLPTLQSALPFLDLHGTPRLEFHQSVFDELREKLMERVAFIAEGKEEDRYAKLEELLEKSFPLVKMPSIQPVVMQVMKHLPKVPEKKLKQVMADKDLYKVCAVEVKRQIWQDNQALFGDEVSPLLKQYIVEKEAALFSSDLSILHNFFSASPKTRRTENEILDLELIKLTQMIGKNVKLYDMVLQFLRTLFLRTRNVHYCTLRAELLMSLHDLDVSEICSVDPCHKVGTCSHHWKMSVFLSVLQFTWCLDACIREKFVDAKRARELQGFLDGVKKGQEQVLGDLSMILCDPFASNTLVLSTVRNLQELLSQDALPRDSPDLLLLLRMLSLGQGAWDMIDSQVFKEPRLVRSSATVSYFLEEPETPFYFCFFPRYLQDNRVACEMGLYYVLHIAKQRNNNALQRLLPALVETYNDVAFGDIFLHLLTGHLTLLSDDFGSEDFCHAVFDNFLLTSYSSKENVHRHTLRLLNHLHQKVHPSSMGILIKTLEPPKQSSDPVKELYMQLAEKLEALKRSPPEPEEAPALDLGLHPVTVPASASAPTTPL